MTFNVDCSIKYFTIILTIEYCYRQALQFTVNKMFYTNFGVFIISTYLR